MRKSINISEGTKKIITEIKEKYYTNSRVTDSYIVSEALKNCEKERVESPLESDKEEKVYQSIKYTLAYEADQAICNYMECGYTADAIVRAALLCEINKLKETEKLEMYKRRYRLIMSEKKMSVISTSGKEVNLVDFLPAIYGVYISKKKSKKRYPLYVGKSLLFADRNATHISSVYDNPEYFGLTDEDIKNDELILTFEIEEIINVEQADTYNDLVNFLCKAETKKIKELKPVTQDGMNMIKSQVEKRDAVLKVINQL